MQKEIIYPIHDKSVIILLNILNKKNEISKKQLRRETHPSFVGKVFIQATLLNYELEGYMRRANIEVEGTFGSLFTSSKKKDNFRAIEVIRKNPKYKVEFINDSHALLIIQNGK